MEKSDAIRRAVRQAPAPQLPAGFTPRLMERLRLETARRERRETWLLTVGGLCGFAILSAACGWILKDSELPRFESLHQFLPHFEFTHFDLRMPSFSLSPAAESLGLLLGGVALIFLVLALADLLIRRRLDAAARN